MSERTGSRLRETLSSPTTWAFVGFALSYVLFFIHPVFLWQKVMYVPELIPVTNRPSIGGDLLLQYEAIRKLLTYGSWGRMFPAVSALFFAPLTLLPFLAAYRVMAVVTLVCYAVVTIFVPLRSADRRNVSLMLVLIAVTGLTSYGLQFELERGQWNVLALTLALASVWLFNRGGRSRWGAYALLALAVQLKLWPLIFILMLVDERDRWRTILLRWGAIVAANAGLLFMLGAQGFNGVSNYVAANTATPRTAVNAHSVFTFPNYLGSVFVKGSTWAPQITRPIGIALLAVALGCLIAIMLTARSRREWGLNPHLLLACALGACLLPPVSNDYKLSILAGPFALLLASPGFLTAERVRGQARWAFSAAVLVLTFAYSSTLYSYAYKSPLLGANTPALLAMMLAVTVLYVRLAPQEEVARAAAPRPGRALSFAVVGFALLLVVGASWSTLFPEAGEKPPVVEAPPLQLQEEALAFTNFNGETVHGGAVPTSFTLDHAVLLTSLIDYHYNAHRGALPGLMWIESDRGVIYGPWAPLGLPAQDWTPNALWLARPATVLVPGTYTVYDSDSATWGQNVASGGRGLIQVFGLLQPDAMTPIE